MSTYAQTTIHSRNSKKQKSNGEFAMGRLVKGIKLGISSSVDKRRNVINLLGDQSILSDVKNDAAIKQQDGVSRMKKSDADYNQYKQSFLTPSNRRTENLKQDHQILFESSIFPAIYFKRTTMRNVLKQFSFPNQCKALPPNDERSPLIYQIIANLFNEITFYVFNILVSQDSITNNYYTFFSDSQIIPFTKCCNMPAYVQMQPNGTGRILCNGKSCNHPSLAQFLINFEDGQKIWKNLTYLNTAPEKDTFMKQQISKFIKTGKFKNYRLKNIVSETNKEVSDIFNQSKYNSETNKKVHNQFGDDAFVTDPKIQSKSSKIKEEVRPNLNLSLNQQEIADLTSGEDKNIELLKVKVQYMAKRQKSLRRNLAKTIIDESKVFHKKFEMSQKIDELLRKTQFSNNSTYLSFPKLLQQIKTKEERRAKAKSVTRGFTN